MLAVADPIVASLCGDVLVCATGQRLELFRFAGATAHPVDVMDAPSEPATLQVSSGGDLIVGRARDERTVWLWRRGHGFRTLASRASARSRFSAGIVEVRGQTFVLVSALGQLQIMSDDGVVARADIGPAPAFDPTHYTMVSADRLAVRGHFPGDPFPAYIIVPWPELLSDARAIHHALTSTSAIKDQAWDLGAGPAASHSLAVYRDPQDLEEEEEDRDPSRPLWALRGIYLRDVDTGEIGDRIPLPMSFEHAQGIVATDRVIAIQVSSSIVIVDRASHAVSTINGDAVALDVTRARFALLRDAIWRLEDL